MLKFENQGPKIWSVEYNNKKIILNLISSTVTNKYHIVTDYITRVSKFHGDEFSSWFMNFLELCENEEEKPAVIFNNVEIIKKYSDEYLKSLNIDYSQFVDMTKVKKNSILFVPQEIEEIIKLSCCLKIYSVISNNENLQLGKKQHMNIYNMFCEKVVNLNIASKIFDVVKTKTFRYNITDKFMWDYIKTIQCKDIGIHIVEIFNFIMNHILILCEEDKNPITYFVGVIDESVKWFLRSVYKGSIVYDDEISTEDIHGTHINNLRSYSFNDTLGRLKAIAFEKIYEKLDQENIMTLNEQNDQYIINFNNRLSTIKFISPLCSCLVFPILSKVTEITYVHFRTISPEHSAALSYYLNILLQKVFKQEYKSLFSLLEFFPETQPSLNTTYKIKAINEFIKIQNNTRDFYGFSSMIFPHKVLCHFVGRVSRINFKHLLTGQKLSGIPLGKVESDMVYFYTDFFSNKLDNKISEISKLINNDF